MTLGFCLATALILSLDMEASCSKIGVIKRVSEESLSTPEELLLSAKMAEATGEIVEEPDVEAPPVAAEEFKEETEEEPSESTPLVAKS